jgi:UDPglucose 6-dehydrogenase
MAELGHDVIGVALFPTLHHAASALVACRRADVVLVLTESGEFTKFRPEDLDAVVRRRTIVDGRNCLVAN